MSFSMYPLSQDPNKHRTNTAFRANNSGWDREYAMMHNYLRYTQSQIDKSDAQSQADVAKTEAEIMKFSEVSVPPGIVIDAVKQHIMDAVQLNTDYQTSLIKQYGFEDPPIEIRQEMQKSFEAVKNVADYWNNVNDQYVASRKSVEDDIKNKTGIYDLDYFDQQTKKAQKGEYVDSFLLPNGANPTDFFTEATKKMEKVESTIEKDVGGKTITEKKVSYKDWTPAKWGQKIQHDYKNIPAITRGIDEDWATNDPNKKYSSALDWAKSDDGYGKMIKPEIPPSERPVGGSGSAAAKEAKEKELVYDGNRYVPRKERGIPYSAPINGYWDPTKGSVNGEAKKVDGTLAFKSAEILSLETVMLNGVATDVAVVGTDLADIGVTAEELKGMSTEEKIAMMINKIGPDSKEPSHLIYLPIKEIGPTLKALDYKLKDENGNDESWDDLY
jgi:hypothetical protein